MKFAFCPKMPVFHAACWQPVVHEHGSHLNILTWAAFTMRSNAQPAAAPGIAFHTGAAPHSPPSAGDPAAPAAPPVAPVPPPAPLPPPPPTPVLPASAPASRAGGAACLAEHATQPTAAASAAATASVSMWRWNMQTLECPTHVLHADHLVPDSRRRWRLHRQRQGILGQHRREDYGRPGNAGTPKSRM